MDPRALGGLRLVQGRLGQRAARTKREVRLSGSMQDAPGRKRYRINCNVSEHAAYPFGLQGL